MVFILGRGQTEQWSYQQPRAVCIFALLLAVIQSYFP
jgi:hypothetical protein